jgi:hypothetical protein
MPGVGTAPVLGMMLLGASACACRADPLAPGPILFTDVTLASGIAVTGVRVPESQSIAPAFQTSAFIGNGVSAGDVDGDGRTDLAVTAGYGAPTVLYRNLGGLRFSPFAGDADGVPFPVAVGVALADLDDDGDPDLVLADGAGDHLYENVGGRMQPRLSLPQRAAVGVLPVDLDGDGLLDLFFYAQDADPAHTGPTAFALRNQGHFSFEDVTQSWGLASDGIAWAAAAFDWDGDGAPDLYVANDTSTPDTGGAIVPGLPISADRLFHNELVDGHRRFRDVAGRAGLATPRASMNVVIEDFDDDGRFDVFVSNWGRNALLLGGADGTYVDGTERLGLVEISAVTPNCPRERPSIMCLLTTWGAARFDANHDGFDDLLLVRGNVSRVLDEAQPTAIWQGGPGTLTRIDSCLGTMAARALLPVDLDGDGDLDLVVTQHGGPVTVFRNEAPPARGWLRVRLAGVRSNRDGVGAMVVARLASGRTVRRLVGAGGLLQSWAPSEAHFVVGEDAIAELEVRWPSGAVTHTQAPTLDRVITIGEQ